MKEKLKRSTRVAILFLIVWGMIAGCGGGNSNDSKDSGTSEEYAPVATDFQNAADQATVAALVTNTATITYSSVQEDLLSMVSGLSVPAQVQRLSPQEADESKEIYNNGGCPVITTGGALLDRTLSISFEDGCTMNDIPVSGIISGQWNYQPTSGGLSIDLDLNDFNMDDQTTDGVISLTADMSDNAEIGVDADLSITTAEGKTETFSADNLSITCDFNSTYLDPEDDQYTLEGAGQYQDSDGNAYSLTFTHVVSTFLCYFPVSGTLTIVSTNPKYTAVIDFGSGACDTEVTITIGKISKAVDLSEPLSL